MSDESVKPEPPNNPSTEPKRRWYQYSLRSLLIIMVLLCFLFALAGVKIREAEKQKEIVEWVEENGGMVYYDFQFDATGTAIPNAQPPGPDWSRNLMGIDFFCNVEEVSFFPPLRMGIFGKLQSDSSLRNFDANELTPLQSLPFLKKIEFSSLFPDEFPIHQEFRKIQEKLPNCEITLDGWLSSDSEPGGEYWCKQCNDLHPKGSDPHTAPN